MKIAFLGEDNENEEDITGDDIPDTLTKFLTEYRRRPDWKNRPALLSLDDTEWETFEKESRLFWPTDENIYAYQKRMLQMIVKYFNDKTGVNPGFGVVFENQFDGGQLVGGKRVGFTFYEYPIYTAKLPDQGGSIPTRVKYHMISTVVPPTA